MIDKSDGIGKPSFSMQSSIQYKKKLASSKYFFMRNKKSSSPYLKGLEDQGTIKENRDD